MGVFDWLFRFTREGPEKNAGVFPWDRRPSIYDHIKLNIRPGQKGLAETGNVLPDDQRVASQSRIKWAPGAMDGVSTHHMGGNDPEQAARLLKWIRAYANSPTVTNKARLYDYLHGKSIVALIDPLLESLRTKPDLNHQRIHELARSFTVESPDRDPVKLGIALLGLYGQKQDIEILRTLGRHEEFTLFCAVALKGCCDDAEYELWELAKHVDGWGRVNLVERLSETENPEIKDWLLRGGYKNSVMYEYLGYSCAVGGGLRDALERDHVDDQMLHAAAEIILALIAGFPGQSMSDYEDGAVVAQRFLDLMNRAKSDLVELLAVNGIQSFLSTESADWYARATLGWTFEKRNEMLTQCSELMRQPHWPTRVLKGLSAEDEQEFFNADRAAKLLKIDTWPYHWTRVKEQPLKSGRWYPVMRECDDNRIRGVIELAESTLPLDQIARGPGSEMGIGPSFEPQSSLGFILQDLGKFPGHGTRLIEVGLKCVTIRNRNMALKALCEWGRAKWPLTMDSLLKQALRCEPEKDVRERIENAIAGKPWKI